MDYFGRAQLRELLETREPPCVSIYLPTHRSSSEAETNRLRFRSAVDRARELLAAEHEPAVRDSILETLEPLTRERDFWVYQSDGLAVFRSPALERFYRLPTSFEELSVVAPTFHTRPLIEYLQAPDKYWVLGLSRKEVRLWGGTAGGLAPMDLKGVPRSLREALGFEFERDDEIVHRRKAGPSRGGRGRGGHVPTFHGHGIGSNDSEPELKRFFKEVDRGLRELLKDEIGPVVLAAVEEYHPLYRSASGLENLAEEGIRASVVEWSPDRLHEEAWPIAKRTALEQVERALELWESSYGRGKGEPDVANLGRLAVAGRVRLLLTERNRRVWGTFERDTGAVEILQEGGDDPGEHAVELLDELAETVILRGGRALVLSAERMPTETGVAGVLR